MRLPLDSLPENLEPTRATLHAYALAVGAIPRVHALAHEKWWHSSLKVDVAGLATERMAFGRGTFRLCIDLHHHEIVLETSRGDERRFSMREGRTGTEMGDALIAAVAELGLHGEYARDKFASDEALTYDPEVASAFFGVLTNVEWTLATHRATLGGSVGPVQVWPHGFDLAFEWFGTRVERSEDHGETVAAPAQLNLGFYPRGDAYFYSNPWPFDAEALVDVVLPFGAVWQTDGWQGSMLRYADVAGLPDAADRVLAYAKAVFDAASPTLTAG
jgi:hypothetical protein